MVYERGDRLRDPHRLSRLQTAIRRVRIGPPGVDFFAHFAEYGWLEFTRSYPCQILSESCSPTMPLMQRSDTQRTFAATRATPSMNVNGEL